MVVCQFYQRGACRFGDNCKNEHPGSQRDANRNPSGGAFGGGSSNNRFNAFGGGDRYRPGQPSVNNSFGGNRDSKTASYHLDKDDINNDLTGQRPIYPLSCYGPGRDAPRQLIEGPVELSPEELRLRYYTLRTAGNEATAQQEESALNEKMQAQVKAILDDISGAIRYVEEGANVHPNRIDIAKGDPSSVSAANPFGGASNSASTAFSKASTSTNPFSTSSSNQTSAFGQASTPGFGKPAFGQPSNPAQTTSAFGQSSSPGPSASPFGTTSSLGQKPSPFGQPSALGGAGAFGKPAFGASGFGQPSMPGAGSAFGQTSSMGQGSAFGQPSASGTASGFGQTNALGQKSSSFGNPGFGQSGFGQSGFGQASQPGAKTSPFGQQAQSGSSPFGQQAQTSASPFGQQASSNPSPFGQQAMQTSQASPFGQQTQQSQQVNPFSQAQSQSAGSNPSPFGGAAPAQPSAFQQPNKLSPFSTQQNQSTPAPAENPFSKGQPSAAGVAASAPSPFGAQGQPTHAFGQLKSQPQQSTSAFVSQGQAPAVGNIDPKDRYKEGKPEDYEGEQGRILEEIYKRVGQLGRFNDDEEIPITPPKCEWIVPMSVL